MFRGHLPVRWTYNLNLHQSHTIQGMADTFLAFLRGCLSHTQTSAIHNLTPHARLAASSRLTYFHYLMNTPEEDRAIYKVVANHEEQYSIWPADRENPLGWKDAGPSGSKSECLEYIKKVWTDMRPLSLRKKMQD